MTLQDVGFEYLDKKKGKFRCRTCKKTYKMLGPHLDNHYLSHKNMNFEKFKQKTVKPKVTEEEYHLLKQQFLDGKKIKLIHNETGRSMDTLTRVKNSTDFNNFHALIKEYRNELQQKKLLKEKLLKGGDTHMSLNDVLTEEEYNAISALLFKGETISRTKELTGRSLATISRVKGSSSYKDYYLKKEYRKTKLVPPLEKEKIPELTPTDRWGNIRLFREKLDNVLIDFILGELEEKTNEIKKENETLKSENEILKQKLQELQEHDFITTLKSKLNIEQKEEGGES